MTDAELGAEAVRLGNGNEAAIVALRDVLRRVRGCGEPMTVCGACRDARDDVQALVAAFRPVVAPTTFARPRGAVPL